ncbi:hypothetical protein [Bacillus sp. AFS055030]|uniref:hypothetical protein n=1 Tax=Bacillus sp. AFS055030 TaxID=2033507 RepID=UPI000BFE53A0|nr:hypothetical protein [Bacillus sp. AFS055030]PGL67803.1 hypothetical protein CN925_19100 [Bacillus sp. AFS055030]
MKNFSGISIILLIIGLVLFGIIYAIPGFNELIALVGFLFLLFGAICSFIAISKREIGYTKFLAVGSFFIIFLLITWFEPYFILRMLTWIKN